LVLDAADAALYRAKEAGRNCLKLDEGIPSTSPT
jgi:GGDEF domain-containing protein